MFAGPLLLATGSRRLILQLLLAQAGRSLVVVWGPPLVLLAGANHESRAERCGILGDPINAVGRAALANWHVVVSVGVAGGRLVALSWRGLAGGRRRRAAGPLGLVGLVGPVGGARTLGQVGAGADALGARRLLFGLVDAALGHLAAQQFEDEHRRYCPRAPVSLLVFGELAPDWRKFNTCRLVSTYPEPAPGRAARRAR